MSELLGCPFCGKPAIESWSRDNEVVNIRCSNWRSNVCLGAGPNSYNLDEAIAAWNRRAQPSSEPVAYKYLFKDPITRSPVWRDSPSEWNGQKPHGSKPLYAHPPTDSAALRDAGVSEQELIALLPGHYYMDPPDGGSVTVLDQLQRLAKDAERYRWLRDKGFQHAFVCFGTDFDGDNFVSYRIDFNLPEPAHVKFEDDEWGTADVDAAIDAAMAQHGEQSDG